MPESIEHNASIIGRVYEPYYKSLMIPIFITEKILIYSNRTVNNSNRTIRQLTVMSEYIDLFCHVHFEEQRCVSATYYVPISANLLAKHEK